MPTISSFYGILIRMFFNDHPPPFHARYGEYEATISIETFEMIEGAIPIRALNLVREWATMHKNGTARRLDTLPDQRSSGQDPAAGVKGKNRMYWDVVEVIPTMGCSLFLRFKDGLEGIIELRPEILAGALEPLQNEDFFRQVFVDNGAVAWPGEIDLAPDAMYAEVSDQQKKTLPVEPYASALDKAERRPVIYQPSRNRNPHEI